ncbi:MAG: SAM-dependent methyltransferase [Lachnospiraceae bacterium]|nr:SAM-dependent methyltransferase [Candidatus Minthocola equi]
MKLSARLETILSLIDPCRCLADIGCDHAFVPIEAVRRGLADAAIASDIGKGPLEGAKKHIEEAGLSGKIDLRLADGLKGTSAGEADTIVITGMGGMLLRSILEDGADVIKDATLILSPQSDEELVRDYLVHALGRAILAEKCIIDEGKPYFIIKSGPGKCEPKYSDFELAYGRDDTFDADSLIIRRNLIEKKIYKLREIKKQLEHISSDCADSRRTEITDELRRLEDEGL